MTELVFDIPKSWWLTANQRLHWADKARRIKGLRNLAFIRARGLNVHHECTHVAAFIGYLTGGRADPGNAAPTIKALIDGMVDAGVWPDDDHLHVLGPTYLRDPKSTVPDHYRVRLVLTEQRLPF